MKKRPNQLDWMKKGLNQLDWMMKRRDLKRNKSNLVHLEASDNSSKDQSSLSRARIPYLQATWWGRCELELVTRFFYMMMKGMKRERRMEFVIEKTKDDDRGGRERKGVNSSLSLLK